MIALCACRCGKTLGTNPGEYLDCCREEGLPEHLYLSTACLHEQHDQCRQTCKFCEAPCICEHHKETS